MDFQDKVLKCIDCSADFVFTVGEQSFYREKQFLNEPKRCRICKTKAKQLLVMRDMNKGRGYSNRVETRTTCSQCGKNTTVPFLPTQGRPVLCRECFQGKRTSVSAD